MVSMPPQQRPRAGHRAGAPVPGGGRLALAACLLALVAAGLRGVVPAPALDGPFRHDSLLTGAVLEGVLACLLIALAVRHWRAPRDAVLAARLRRLLTYVVAAALVVIPVGYLPLNHQLKPRPQPQHQSGKARQFVPPHLRPGGPPLAAVIVLVILAVLVAALLIYLIVRFWRVPRLGRRRWRSQAVDVPVQPGAGDDEESLREAVESGQSALRQVDDTRAAIIACYAAMEQSLAQAGAVRAAADTPDELLARAASQGLVSGGSAARLTAVFYEARFSSHPMSAAQRDDAERALGELAASLGGPEPAGLSGAGR
jgi:Domain of unknown function (DUF4129)